MAAMNQKTQTALVSPPCAEKRPLRSVCHGFERVDDYAWLRADNWQEVMREPGALCADIREYLEAENAYTAQMMADTEALQETLFKEMKGRVKEDDATVPAPDGPYAYFTSYVTGGQYPRLCRQLRGGSEGKVLLDGDALAAGKPYFSLGATAWSFDHKLLAYAVDEKGSEFYAIKVRDLEKGEDLADVVPDMEGFPVWSADATSFYYTRVDEHRRPTEVFRHRLGTSVAEDELIYREPDPGFFTRIAHSQDRRFLLIASGDHETSEARFVSLSEPGSVPTLVAPRETHHQYQIEHHEG